MAGKGPGSDHQASCYDPTPNRRLSSEGARKSVGHAVLCPQGAPTRLSMDLAGSHPLAQVLSGWHSDRSPRSQASLTLPGLREGVSTSVSPEEALGYVLSPNKGTE